MLRMVVYDILLVIAAIFFYSPGFLALRPTDESILRAGCSILFVPVLLFLFYLANWSLFQKRFAIVYNNKAYIMDEDVGERLSYLNSLVSQLPDIVMFRTANDSVGMLVHMFSRICDSKRMSKQEQEDALHELLLKIDFYMKSFEETLLCIIDLDRFGSYDEQDYEKLIETLNTLREVFRFMLDDASGSSKISSEQDLLHARMELDGYMDNVVRTLADSHAKDKY